MTEDRINVEFMMRLSHMLALVREAVAGRHYYGLIWELRDAGVALRP